MEEALSFAPDHIKILYDLSELYSADPYGNSAKQRENYTLKLVEKTPGNLVPKLNLTEIYIKNGETDKALEQLEVILKQFPEFPREAVAFYDKTLALLKKNDKENAFIQFTVFHNYLKVTSPYQAGMQDLKGPGGSLIGFPLITFDQKGSTLEVDSRSLLDIIKFTDVTSSAGLDIVAPGEAGFRLYITILRLLIMTGMMMLTFMPAATTKHLLHINTTCLITIWDVSVMSQPGWE